MARWNRGYLKEYAKEFLREHYLKAFVVCLIVVLLTGGVGSASNRSRRSKSPFNEKYIISRDFNDSFYKNDSSIFKSITRIIRAPFVLIGGGAIALTLFIFSLLYITLGYALEVGKSRFFLDGFKGDASINRLFSTFNSTEYFSIVKTQFLRKLYEFLWTLLLVIPGIIKSYEYRLVPYILAEEPNLPSNEVISKSRDLTYGHKMDIFVLDLSFIGWVLLGGLLCGIGIIFVNPYIAATEARLYNVLAGNDYFDDNIYKNEDKDFDIVVE